MIKVYTDDKVLGNALTWSDADALAQSVEADVDVYADETIDGRIIRWAWSVHEGDSTPDWWVIQ